MVPQPTNHPTNHPTRRKLDKMNKKTAIIIALVVLVCSGCALGEIPTPTPTATPRPTPQPVTIVDTSADDIRAVFDGLDTIEIDELVKALANAGRADTKTAHTSELGQLIADISPALPWVALALLFVCCTVVALGALATWRAERKRQPLQALEARLEEMARLFESVAPRNNEDENDAE